MWDNMDRYPIEVDKFGTIVVDTSSPIKQSRGEVIERCQSVVNQNLRIEINPHLACEDLWQLYQKRINPIARN